MARLLLVDDDISEISAVKRVLSRTGHAPLLATNSSDALTSVGQARPDLILLGATCEGGRALEAIGLLDEEEATREIPLIILGEASGAPARAVQLPRPIDPAALAEHVKQFLSSAPAATPFERRVSSTELPAFLERRTGPSDSALARKAAAEALLARARELRGTVRGPPGGRPTRSSSPAPAEAAAGLDALFELEPPAGVGGSSEPVAETPFDLPEVPPLDLSMEEPAERRTAVVPPYEPATVAAEPEPFQLDAPQPPAAPPPADSAPTPAPAPSPDWEHDRDEELEARRFLEEELRQLREQLDADRRKHDEELHTVLEQATVREQAALERQASAAEAAASRAVAEAEARFGAALEKLRASASTGAERHPPARSGPRPGKASRPDVGEPVQAEAPMPFFADVPPPDPAQQAARRRALSRRAPADSAAAGAALPAEPPWALSPPEAPPAELRAGNLDDLPMARLLATALKARAVGRLDVVGEATRALWFEDGHVVGAASNVAGERLDEVALRLGLLTREQHRQVAGAGGRALLAPRRGPAGGPGVPQGRRADLAGAGPDRGGGLRHLRRGQRPLPLGRRSGPVRRADRARPPAAGAGRGRSPAPLAGPAPRGHPGRPGHAGDAGPRRPDRRRARAPARRAARPRQRRRPAHARRGAGRRARSTPSRPASCWRRWC